MISAIILAAGPSIRLGRPKQNLMYNEQTLLQLTISAVSGVVDQVIVVLGANEEIIAESIIRKPVTVLSNPHYQEGMASSVRLAISHLSQQTQVTHALCMVCDQPFITSELLRELKNVALHGNMGIVATAYGGTVGVPVIFAAKYFPELMELMGDDGAKKVVIGNQHDLHLVCYDKAAIDIDTEDDYKRLDNGK